MFVLVNVADTIAVEAADLGKGQQTLVLHLAKQRFLNQVLPDIGLVVAVTDVSQRSENQISDEKRSEGVAKPSGGVVRAGDRGRCHFKVNCRLLVFRPLSRQIIEGRVVSADNSGLTVSIEFFKDVKILQAYLREPKAFNAEQGLWCWLYDGHELYYEIDQRIRFKVQDVKYNKLLERGPTESFLSPTEQTYVPPMVVIGRVDEDGLGMLPWWE